jgi:hypothetical protein
MEAEDVEWSNRIQKFTKICFNEKSTVKMLKHNHVIYKSPGRLRTKMILGYSHGKWRMLDNFYRLVPKKVEERIYSAATSLLGLTFRFFQLLKLK